MLTLTSCILRFDQAESFWMPTDLVKFPVHSICLLRKKLWHLAGCCYFFFIFLSEPGVGVGYPLLRSKCACSAYMSVWRGRCVCVCAHAQASL